MVVIGRNQRLAADLADGMNEVPDPGGRGDARLTAGAGNDAGRERPRFDGLSAFGRGHGAQIRNIGILRKARHRNTEGKQRQGAWHG